MIGKNAFLLHTAEISVQDIYTLEFADPDECGNASGVTVCHTDMEVRPKIKMLKIIQL